MLTFQPAISRFAHTLQCNPCLCQGSYDLDRQGRSRRRRGDAQWSSFRRKSGAGDDRHREVQLALLHRLLDGDVSFPRKGAIDSIAFQLCHVAADVSARKSSRDLAEGERQRSSVSDRNLIDNQIRRLGCPDSLSFRCGGGRPAGIDSVREIPVKRAVCDIAAEDSGKINLLNLSLDRDGAFQRK